MKSKDKYLVVREPGMTYEEVAECLCHYDKRNPYYVGYERDITMSCYCDNCHMGKSKLAEEIMRVKFNDDGKKAN